MSYISQARRGIVILRLLLFVTTRVGKPMSTSRTSIAGSLITGIFRFMFTTLPARNFAPEQFQAVGHHGLFPGSPALLGSSSEGAGFCTTKCDSQSPQGSARQRMSRSNDKTDRNRFYRVGRYPTLTSSSSANPSRVGNRRWSRRRTSSRRSIILI